MVNIVSLLNKRLVYFLSHNLHWKRLNTIQKKAIPSILKGDDTLVIAPTASGKTEAVLIPIFNEIITKGLDPLSVIYVSPLKALINNMNNRIEYWGSNFGLTTTRWHGDVSSSEKSKFIKNPTDFLTITPESLEVILMNKNNQIKSKIFRNVKYIIIDEIHYFADSDRGVQLNSILNRLCDYIEGNVTTVGLSATVGNPELIAEWINYEKPASIVKQEGYNKFEYKLINFPEELVHLALKKYINKKVLVFANSRETAELIHYKLKEDLSFKNVFIHHSSMDKDLKESNEKEFEALPNGFMISTSTLELGIDIGDIDIVVQVTPPYNIGSFLQRIGRSGRRNGVPRTLIFAQQMDIFISLAELILIEEKKLEDIKISNKSMDILFHQILSQIFNGNKIHAQDLYDKLVQCYVFSGVTYKEFKFLLNDMCLKEFIDINNGYVSFGYNFEKIFGKRNFMEFYSVFFPSYEYSIKEGRKEIGKLDVSYAIQLSKDEEFVLGGILWKVLSINHNKFSIKVSKQRNIKEKIPVWISDGPPLNYLISRKIYDIILDDFDRKYLKYFDNTSIKFIESMIIKANKFNFKKGVIPIEIDSQNNEITIYTFAGDKANQLLMTLFNLKYKIYKKFSCPFYCSFRVKKKVLSYEEIIDVLMDVESVLSNPDINIALDKLTKVFIKNKFIYHLPEKYRMDLKFNILFDKDGLIDLVKNNEPMLVNKSFIKSDFFKYD